MTTPTGVPDSRFGEMPLDWLLDLTACAWVDRSERIELLTGVHNSNDSTRIVTRHPIGPRPNRPRWFFTGTRSRTDRRDPPRALYMR